MKDGRLVASISVRDMPEVLADLRMQMAGILREQADNEVSSYVAARLRDVATKFELGGGHESGERRRS